MTDVEKAPKTMTPIEAFLAALVALALEAPELEGQVLWHRDGQWSDASGEMLEAEEIAFYAEGLLMEGFGLHWDQLNSPVGGIGVIRLCFWQGQAPALPPFPEGWQSVRQDGFIAA